LIIGKRSFWAHLSFLFVSALLLGQGVLGQGAWAQIAKCQDASGKWHYGNFAADVCAQSDITHMDEQGNIVGQDSRPLTDAEQLQIEKEAELEARVQAGIDSEQAERERILRIYDSEQGILRMRDRKLESIKLQIAGLDILLRQRKSRLEQVVQNLATTVPEATGLIERLGEEQAVLISEISACETAVVDAQHSIAEMQTYFQREMATYRKYN
jgi:hypothetical protein